MHIHAKNKEATINFVCTVYTKCTIYCTVYSTVNAKYWATLIEKFRQVSLYVTDDANAKLYLTKIVIK